MALGAFLVRAGASWALNKAGNWVRKRWTGKWGKAAGKVIGATSAVTGISALPHGIEVAKTVKGAGESVAGAYATVSRHVSGFGAYVKRKGILGTITSGAYAIGRDTVKGVGKYTSAGANWLLGVPGQLFSRLW